ncbi:MAG: hypothetical protein IIA59_09295 [Candidatus Marinimicrobia bacterium]|nr:hypothetical protein [Candidatus Neomarinimicrobiota bacterium]
MSNRPVRIRIKKLFLPEGSQEGGDQIKATLQQALQSQFQTQPAQDIAVTDVKAQVIAAVQRALKR